MAISNQHGNTEQLQRIFILDSVTEVDSADGQVGVTLIFEFLSQEETVRDIQLIPANKLIDDESELAS